MVGVGAEYSGCWYTGLCLMGSGLEGGLKPPYVISGGVGSCLCGAGKS